MIMFITLNVTNVNFTDYMVINGGLSPVHVNLASAGISYISFIACPTCPTHLGRKYCYVIDYTA